MKTIVLDLFLLITIALLAGCATSRSIIQEPVIAADHQMNESNVLYRNQFWDGAKGVDVECKSASKLGCRHKGRFYPWNAWLNVKGYDAREYDMKEVIQEGNRATVVIVRR